MINFTRALSAGALVWCAVLTWQTTRPPVVSDGAAVVAYLHGDTLNAEYQLVQYLQTELMEEIARVDSALVAGTSLLETEAMELIAFAQSDAVTESELQMAGGRMHEIEAQIEQMRKGAQQVLTQQERDLQKEIAERLSSELAAFAEQEGIDILLNWGLSGEGVLHGSTGYDITAPLLDFLNGRYERASKGDEE